MIATVVLALSVAGFVLVAIVALLTAKRLRLDPWAVLLWFGLADAPAARSARLAMVRDRARRANRRPASAPGT